MGWLSRAASAGGRAVDAIFGGANTHDEPTAQGGAPLADTDRHGFFGSIGQGIGDFGRGLGQEGLGGLIDPRGMMDRQHMQRQLSDRFQVTDDFVGMTASNKVSQHQFQNIARTLSDVRLGRGDLTLDGSQFEGQGSRRNWENKVTANLADVAMTNSGRDQIYNLSNNYQRKDDDTPRLVGTSMDHEKTSIQPLFDSSGRHDDAALRYDNADAAYSGEFGHLNARRHQEDGSRGFGTGSQIHFNPAPNVAGARSDVILAHEMQHAWNETQGTMIPGVMASGPDATMNKSERQAVGLARPATTDAGTAFPVDNYGMTENQYRAERNLLGDRFLPRESYSTLPDQAPASTTPLQLAMQWANHLTSGNAQNH